MNAAVWVNDQFLGDGGSMSPPIARSWNHPLIFLLPESAWQADNNYLYVQLATYPGWGNLPGVILGPNRVLAPEYRLRSTWQNTGVQINFFIILIAALVGFTLWLARRSATEYLYFFFTCIAGAIFCSNLFLLSAPLEPRLWSWVVHSALDWYCVGIAVFGLQLLGIRSPWRTRLLVGFGIGATVVYGFFDLYQFLHSTVYVHTISILISVYLTVVALISMWQQRNLEATTLFCCLLILLGLSVHDLALDAEQGLSQWRDNVYLLNYAFAILMLTMIVVLTRQFARSIRAEAQAELRVRMERERLYSDIHDDIGSRLLSLVYTADNEKQADIARESLREVRTILSGATQTYDELDVLLEACEAEARQRCQLASVTLHWTVTHIGQVSVPDLYQYHLQRILRELITNALKHTNTPAIDVQASIVDDTLVIEVTDHGTSSDQPALESRMGIAGIRRRIQEMAGDIQWQPSHTGCIVQFSLPIR